ncbi:hypothetical protein MRB53_002823 [Persea americana]|uniref:Uncharacterized protein n=1 Tax=Persea americana TaxID=3435 RepID=A0ACC2MVY4_PERAE|nr:hypothetical protein MRB53_002823 [Persea americana]|eukprot:TRINITY_DN37784_c0_g1_i2.p1 TRINITY_DN37784_c0_g1~~TRINITY_DN37784_c0_g1_i2.p1  ORF type:complete len:295 (+),score=41.83 TRINITY_DN37784_c0_g1_i2:86-970(+)
MQAAAKHQSWRISVHAKAKNFNFKLKAWKTNGTGFSILVKIHHFFLKMVSKTGFLVDSTHQKESSKWKLLRLFSKFHRRKIAHKAGDGKAKQNTPFPGTSKRSDSLPYEEPIAAITGNLGLLTKSVALRDYGGIAIHAFTIFFYLISLFRNFLTRSYFLVASLVSSIGFSLSYLNYKGLISDTSWKAWNHAVSFGCLYLLTQVIFSRFSLFMGRNKLVGFLISATLPLSQLTSDGSKQTMDGAPAWTANLLLASQTFFHVLGNPKDPKNLAFFISSTHCLLKDLANILAPYIRN